MKTTRDRILYTLHKKPASSINDLAEAVDINPISVRHHLGNLQIDGLIKSQEERHGVGRPRLIYSLTERGAENFPTRYMHLTSRLLDQLKTSLPESTVSTLFTEMATTMADEYSDQLQGMSMEERLELVREVLSKEGFSIEWEKVENQYHIHEITCPYLQIGQNHPEICIIDQTLISKMLAVPAEKVQCVLDGSPHCTYVIEPEKAIQTQIEV